MSVRPSIRTITGLTAALTSGVAAAALVATAPAGAAVTNGDARADRSLVPGAVSGTADVAPLTPPELKAGPASADGLPTSSRAGRPLFAFWGAKYNTIDGFGFQTATRGSGTSVRVAAAWKTYTGIRPIMPKKVFVQARVDGGSWSRVAGVRGKITKKGEVWARVPAYTVTAGVPAQTVEYRLKTKKITKGPRRARRSVASKPVAIRFENQAMYTGEQARFYAPIANLCPNANVTIDTTGTITGEHDAVFDWQYGISMDVASLAQITWESEASKQAIAIHECAHFKQFYNWGGTRSGWTGVKERSAAVFVADSNPSGPTAPMTPRWEPLEHAADCATFLVTSGAERTYGGYCNPTESAAAGLLWQNLTY